MRSAHELQKIGGPLEKCHEQLNLDSLGKSQQLIISMLLCMEVTESFEWVSAETLGLPLTSYVMLSKLLMLSKLVSPFVQWR